MTSTTGTPNGFPPSGTQTAGAKNPRSHRRGLSGFFGVGGVGLLTYIGEYASYIVVLAFLSDKLTISFGFTAGFALIGTISGVYLVLSGLVAIPIGYLSDKYGRRRFTLIICL